MRLTEALDYESKRESLESRKKILLNHDGKFYHAYDWSAFVLCAIVCADKEMPKPMYYKTKNHNYAMAGFPLGSLGKFIPEYNEYEELENGDLLIDVDLTGYEDKTLEELDNDFNEWAGGLPIQESAKKPKPTAGDTQQSALAKSGLFNIVSQILSYPLESSTPAQNIEFIGNIKRQVASLL